MRKDIANFTKTCQQCAKSKVLRHNTTPLSPVLPPPTERFTHIYVDLTGPPNESCGYRYLTVIIDRFSRFIHAIPLVGISSEECVIAFIHNWVALFGCPEKFFYDQGTQFTSSLWHETFRFLGCQMKHSTAYYPQAQGLVERQPLLKGQPSSLRRTVSMVSQSALGLPCFMQQSQTGFTFSFTCQLCFSWSCSPTRRIFCTRDRRSYTNT